MVFGMVRGNVVAGALLVALASACSKTGVAPGVGGKGGGATDVSTGGAGGVAGGGGMSMAAGAGGFGGSSRGGAPSIGQGGVGGGGTEIVSLGWRTLPSLTKKRQNAIGVAVGGTMYVMGGLDESGLLDVVESLVPGQTGWTLAPSLPVHQCCAAAGVLGTVIAVAGGYEADGHTPTNALLLFDTTTGTWRTGAPMPTARANAMGAVSNGTLAVIGGGTQYGALQATGVIEIYDPTANTWATSPLAVTPRAGGTAVVDADRIYVIGGALQTSLYGDSIVEIVTTNGVVVAPALGLGRVQLAGGLLPSGIAVAGGWTAEGDTPTAEGLFGRRTGWQSIPAMPTSRAGAATAVIDGSLIVAGGGQFSGMWTYQDAVEALTAN